MKYYYFYDCPRTGGTTFKRWCRNGQIKRVCFGDEKDWHHVPFKPRAELERLVPNGGELFTFTILRDPIEHTASLYAKIKRHKHGYRPVIQHLSFDQWINGKFKEDAKTMPDPWGFSMVKFYDPKTHCLNQAIKNIETMDFVGFTDRLNEDLNLMLIESRSKVKFNGPRLNCGIRDFVVKDQIKAIIREVRKDDYKLVNHFRCKRGLEPYA